MLGRAFAYGACGWTSNFEDEDEDENEDEGGWGWKGRVGRAKPHLRKAGSAARFPACVESLPKQREREEL